MEFERDFCCNYGNMPLFCQQKSRGKGEVSVGINFGLFQTV